MTEPVFALAPESPRQDAVIRLLAALDAYQSALYPAESNHFLDLDALAAPNVRFFVARLDGEAVGCGALRIHHYTETGGYGELKRMYVAPAARGHRIARRILERIEAEARAAGLACLRLETGIHQPEALTLYRSAGYAERGAFGAYAPEPLSVFMEKIL
jgi:putative acetyltransferase